MGEKIIHLKIEGIVQGVYYRQSTIEKAKEIGGIDGWVRNRSDASVELLAQGAEAKIDALVNWCRIGPSAAQVNAVEELPYTETEKAILPPITPQTFRKEATF